MARKKKKKGYGHRKSTKRSRAAKRAYKKSGLYKYNLKRKGKKRRKGKKKKKYGGKKKSGRRKYARARGGLSPKGLQQMQLLINKGYPAARAHKIVSRLERMKRGRSASFFGKEAAQREVARAQEHLGSFFAGIGQVGRAHKALGG